MLKTVSTQLALASDTLSEILANGNTSGPNNIIMDAGYGINGTLGAITPASVVATTGTFNNNGNENLFIADTANTSRSSFQVAGPSTYFNANIDSASHGNFVWRSSNALTERLRIDASGHAIIPAGVTLGTAAGVYAADNTLDDYEEGTFSITSDSAEVVIAANTGYYTKIGRVVTCTGAVTVSSIGTPVGNVGFDGLPFATANVTDIGAAISLYTYGWKTSMTTHVMASLSGNSSSWFVQKSNGAGTVAVLSGDVQATTYIQYTIVYQTA